MKLLFSIVLFALVVGGCGHVTGVSDAGAGAEPDAGSDFDSGVDSGNFTGMNCEWSCIYEAVVCPSWSVHFGGWVCPDFGSGAGICCGPPEDY